MEPNNNKNAMEAATQEQFLREVLQFSIDVQRSADSGMTTEEKQQFRFAEQVERYVGELLRVSERLNDEYVEGINPARTVVATKWPEWLAEVEASLNLGRSDRNTARTIETIKAALWFARQVQAGNGDRKELLRACSWLLSKAAKGVEAELLLMEKARNNNATQQ